MQTLDCLMERYPEIGFHLTFSSFEPFELTEDLNKFFQAKRGSTALYSDDISKELKKWRKELPLDQIEILYVYGIGLGYYYEAVKDWLHEKKERRLIFIEDDLAVLEAIARIETSCVSDPQVFIRFISEGESQDCVLEELTSLFPSDRIDVSALLSYRRRNPKKVRTLRESLLRKTTVVSALLADILHSHKLFANLVKNFRRAHLSFFANRLKGQFENVPAIICGAGPSLKESLPLLRECENRALIFAGGSTFTALTSQGILPHLGMALDPNPDEYDRLLPNAGFEVPMIYGNRVLPDIFNTFNGPCGYLSSNTGGSAELWLEEKCGITEEPIGPDLDQEAMSVTTLAISLAQAMGCNPIILTGVDLAYTNSQRYAPGVVVSTDVDAEELKKVLKAGDQLIHKKDRSGKPILTMIKWLMESASISRYAKKHPKRLFINATSGGIGFKGMPYIPLNQVVEEHCLCELDLRGRIHQHIQRHPFLSDIQQRSQNSLSELQESLKKCLMICEAMLNELQSVKAQPDQMLPSGKMVILEVDFQEEPAFEALLNSLGPAIDRIVQRGRIFQDRLTSIEQLLVKWDQYRSVIKKCLDCFN